MKKAFTIKGSMFQFSDEEVKRAATTMNLGITGRVRFYAKVNGKLYSVRQLLVELIKQKGITMPDVTTHEAIRVLRALGFEIIEA